MEQLKTLKNAILNNRTLRKNGREIRKLKKKASKVAATSPKSGDYAIFVQPKNGMTWERYTPDRPLESEFMVRLLCGALVHNGRYANVKVARWNAVRNDWGYLRLKPSKK